MSVFIDVVTTGSLQALIREGQPDVMKAWESIYSEFCEISQNGAGIEGLSTAIQIQYYSTRIKNVYFIVNYLRNRNVPGLIAELQDMGFNFTYTDLQKDLDRTLTRVKSDEAKLNAALAKYHADAEKKQDTKLDWMRRLSQLAKYQGVASINPALITVLNFVALEKEFMEYVKAQK